MFKVVLDTNVLISATIRKGNQFRLLELGRLNQIQIIISPQILEEVKEVLNRPKFSLSQNEIEEALNEIKDITHLVEPSEKVDIVKEDPDDNMIIECAIAGKADYIISGDDDLLELKEYKGIKIRNSQSFIQETNL
ncbi:MAG: putative toxin-antitoxin system toxin component, PIN family [Nanoarchaeota archaeon]